MKAETAKRVAAIRSRAKDLKNSFLLELKGKGPDGTLVPRVSGIVIREGLWIVSIARKLVEKYAVDLTKDEAKLIDDAELFYGEMKENHGDEAAGGGFIYRVEGEFITHLDKVSALVQLIDKKVELEKAKLETEFDGDIPEPEMVRSRSEE